MIDPYKILGVDRNADKDTIKKAYRKLAREWHPDKNPDKQEEATKKFKEINEAFDMLENPQKSRSKPFTSPMDDIFSQIFGQQRQRTPVGDHIIVTCTISLEDVLHGCKKDIVFSRNDICKTCNGIGGTAETCSHCQGQGVKITIGPAMTVKSTCHACSGTGKSITSKCENCEDGYLDAQEQTIPFDIPKGVQNGMRFCHHGQGQPCKLENGINGDLYIQIHVALHEKFEVLGEGNIICGVKVDYTQLVLGDNIDVPTLEGTVSFNIPKGTTPNQRFRLRDLGLPRFNNGSHGIYTRADQLVEIQLNIPTDLDDDYKNVIEKLSQLESDRRGIDG